MTKYVQQINKNNIEYKTIDFCIEINVQCRIMQLFIKTEENKAKVCLENKHWIAGNEEQQRKRRLAIGWQ